VNLFFGGWVRDGGWARAFGDKQNEIFTFFSMKTRRKEKIGN